MLAIAILLVTAGVWFVWLGLANLVGGGEGVEPLRKAIALGEPYGLVKTIFDARTGTADNADRRSCRCRVWRTGAVHRSGICDSITRPIGPIYDGPGRLRCAGALTQRTDWAKP